MTNELVAFPKFELQVSKQAEFKPEVATATVKELVVIAKKVTAVLTHKDLNEASVAIKDIAKVKNELEAHRKALKDPFKTHGEKIDAYFKSLIVEINKEDERLRKGVYTFNERQKEIARAKAEEERERLQAQLAKEVKEAEETGAPIPDAVLPEVEVKVEKLSDQNVAGMKETQHKAWRVTDIAKVPVDYLIVDEKKMNEKRKEFDKDAPSPIPGIEFYVKIGVKL